MFWTCCSCSLLKLTEHITAHIAVCSNPSLTSFCLLCHVISKTIQRTCRTARMWQWHNLKTPSTCWLNNKCWSSMTSRLLIPEPDTSTAVTPSACVRARDRQRTGPRQTWRASPLWSSQSRNFFYLRATPGTWIQDFKRVQNTIS
jgi:hypothetical protein